VTQSFEGVSAGLRDLCSLAAEYGLSRGSDRVSELARTVERFAKANAAGLLQQAADSVGHVQTLWILTEGVELASLMPWLRSYPRELLQEKLEQVLEGPLDPRSESNHSNRARNIAFELSLGCRLIANGCEIVSLPLVDLAVRVFGQIVLFQCKRPLVARRLHANARDAYHQLSRDLDTAPRGAFGVVAINVSRAINPDSLVFLRETRGGADLIDRDLEHLRDEYSRTWRSMVDPRVIGIGLRAQSPAYYNKEAPPIASIQRGLIIPLHPAGSRENNVLLGVASKLSRGGWLRVG